MPFTRDARRAYDRARRKGGQRPRERSSTSSNGARAKARAEHDVSFVGVDGEGVTRPDGSHDYNLLSVGDRSLHHLDGRRLTFDDVAGFLWECHVDDPDPVMVGFFLGYDFAQWLRDLPEERARSLLTEPGRAARVRKRSGGNPIPFPVRWGPWEFDLLPNMRRFKLRPSHVGQGRCVDCGAQLDPGGTTRNDHRWLYVCDTGPYFQSSLLRAVDPDNWPEPVLTPAEYAQLEAGKAAREGAPVEPGTPVDPKTIAYNRLENDVLARVMSRYNLGLVAMGVRLTRTQWHGPGQAAQAWLKQVAPAHVGDNWRQLPTWDRLPYDAATASYFGGWFEITAHGPVPGSTWDYDVNSAYPHIIAGLPCLLPGHGVWRYGEGVAEDPPDPRYRLVRASVSGSNPWLGAMPHRTPRGRVLRPHSTSGWYWSHELAASVGAGLVDRIEIAEWWGYYPACDCAPPFRAIADLYRERLRIGKNTPHGRALRLVYNSTYGKMAQSVGTPLFSNPVYASLITAGCRAMILDAIASHPEGAEAVVMVATDGVYFTSRHPGLDVDPERLGAWDETELHDLSLFKPGVYWSRKALKRSIDVKSRGVNERALLTVVDRLDTQWRRRLDRSCAYGIAGLVELPAKAREPAWWPKTAVRVPFAVTSPRQALNRNRWELCGRIDTDSDVEQSASPHGKRVAVPPAGSTPDAFYRSRPYTVGDGGEASTPYDKRFGIELREGGWADEIVTPEGTLLDVWRELFRGGQ
jgi:hypothetical protein